MKKQVIIMGAGPAGLGAASELTKNKISPVLVDKDKQVGGLSKTVKFNDYYFDLGGHRFYTKINEVEKLWHDTLKKDFIKRPRVSRIYFRNKFFDYPLNLKNSIKNLGGWESFLSMGSYLESKLFPQEPEDTFDTWVSNRFGKRLFKHFFKTYTEKLWGMPCEKIQAEWAAQRIKNLSLWGAVKNALNLNKKDEIKSLIDKFDYPKRGPGMMYEKIALNSREGGAEILLGKKVKGVIRGKDQIKAIETDAGVIEGRNFLSSIPITELVTIMSPEAPPIVVKAAKQLSYRSFVTVNIVYKTKNRLKDTWLYIHSPEVKLGRVQVFNNWSPYMVKNKGYTSLGLEYFCTEGDVIWEKEENEMVKLADTEVKKIGLIRKNAEIVQAKKGRYAKAYSVYDPGYKKNLTLIKKFLESIKNLQPIGRYGMFRYNNMDHSIYTGMLAARNIIQGTKKYDVWKVNQDQEYVEEKK